jgi:AcrR family transcriptional regulator
MSDEPSTRERIENAIEEMREAGSRMTIAGVAREAGVSNAAIHNRYPDLAARIRELSGKAGERNLQAELSRRRGNIKREQAQRRALRDQLAEKTEQLRKASSVNASLDLENQSLKAEIGDLKRQLAEARQLSVPWEKRGA